MYSAEAAGFCTADGTALRPVDAVPVSTDPDDPIVGHTIADRLEVRRVIAEGSMGRVYEARELRADRRVAVKILHSEVADDPVNIERFRREAETSLKLDHTYIVDVIDFASVPSVPGRSARTWYLAMEYLDGEELRALLTREKLLPLASVVRVTSQVALALDPAHRAGFVHRDMKPDNIFVVRVGDDLRVKLLDFGSVKFTRGQDRGHKLTVLGTTIGSPFYMAPEQAQGDPDLDHRADVWAINAIVYEMLVGRVPFKGTNGPQILFRILSDEPEPPTFANEKLPASLDDVLMKGFRKKPSERFQTVGELADALGRALGLSGDHAEWALASTAALTERLPSAGAMRAPTSGPHRAASEQKANARAAEPERAPAAPSGGDGADVEASVFVKPTGAAPYVAVAAVVLLLIGAVVALTLR